MRPVTKSDGRSEWFAVVFVKVVDLSLDSSHIQEEGLECSRRSDQELVSARHSKLCLESCEI